MLFSKINKYFNNQLDNKKIAIWGLSFKPDTDDMRQAPSINLIRSLVNANAIVNAYDPQAMKEAKFYLKDYDVNYFSDKYSTLVDADVLVLVTEWKEFRSPDFDKIKEKMKGNLIVDGRNQYNSERLRAKGFTYLQIGVKDN